MKLAILLFIAGFIEYGIVTAWYDAYSHGKVIFSIVLTHIQLVLWLFILNSLIEILGHDKTPWWIVLSYIEGCAAAVAVMTIRKKLRIQNED